MHALIIDAASATAVLGVSPWVLPLIAVVAKRKEDELRRARRRWFLGVGLRRGGGAEPDDRTGDCVAMRERLRAKLEAAIWRD